MVHTKSIFLKFIYNLYTYHYTIYMLHTYTYASCNGHEVCNTIEEMPPYQDVVVQSLCKRL